MVSISIIQILMTESKIRGQRILMDNFMLSFVFYYLKRWRCPCSGDTTTNNAASLSQRPIDGGTIWTPLHLYAERASRRGQGHHVWNYCTKIVLLTDCWLDSVAVFFKANYETTEKSVRKHDSVLGGEVLCLMGWSECRADSGWKLLPHTVTQR